MSHMSTGRGVGLDSECARSVVEFEDFAVRFYLGIVRWFGFEPVPKDAVEAFCEAFGEAKSVICCFFATEDGCDGRASIGDASASGEGEDEALERVERV